MANHVGIGEVDDEDIKGAICNRLYNRVCDASGAHFRLQVVSGDFRRGHKSPILAGKRLLNSTVEEVSDVSVFFGFGHAQVSHFGLGHDVGQNVFQRLRPDDYRQAEVLVVSRHAYVMQILGYSVARNSGFQIFGARQVASTLLVQTAVTCESARDLADAVSAKIKAYT